MSPLKDPATKAPRTKAPRPLVLCILDGWGHREACDDNAICQAATPVLDALAQTAPHALIDASAGEVGLPEGQMGNSEVGHMNLGAGRVVLQDLPRIDEAFAKNQVTEMSPMADFIAKTKAGSGRVHLLGLLSPGGVHAHQDHMAKLAVLLNKAGLEVWVHAFLDGRDTPPKSALAYLERFSSMAPEVRFATVSGRYYAMDRDQNWARVEQAVSAMTLGQGPEANSAKDAVEQGYQTDTSDEFILPTVIAGYRGFAQGDSLLMANFRADRARAILHALLDPGFTGFAMAPFPRPITALGLVDYSSQLNSFLSTLFAPVDLHQTLGEVVAEAGLTQLRIAETEKYAHVTFFFNGGREDLFPGEARILVPSPKVATYDLQPEMSAPEVTDKLVAAIESGGFDLIVVNYANGDMVGHTGNLSAAIKAAEVVDSCLGRLRLALDKVGGAMLITADHGNAEMMNDPQSGQAHTAHTMNKVPLLLVGAPPGVQALRDGRLADIAPTLLDLMDLPQPKVMTGRSLLARRDQAHLAAE